MSTDALELALALHQSPIQRFSLRDRPLPGNIGEALQLASAAQPQLENAAARFQESEETIVEAVRFYLQQVLFEPGTDAYRVLGLAPKAELTQLRQHHIWLQRWLHPDRRGEDWEAVLATKVNWAWSQLRNEATRAEYDRTRLSAAHARSASGEGGIVVQAPAWKAAPLAAPRPHWLSRGAIGGMSVVCLGLLYLALTRQDRVDPDALAWQSVKSDSSIRARLPFDEVADRSAAPAAAPIDVPLSPSSPVTSYLPVPLTGEPKPMVETPTSRPFPSQATTVIPAVPNEIPSVDRGIAAARAAPTALPATRLPEPSSAPSMPPPATAIASIAPPVRVATPRVADAPAINSPGTMQPSPEPTRPVRIQAEAAPVTRIRRSPEGTPAAKTAPVVDVRGTQRIEPRVPVVDTTTPVHATVPNLQPAASPVASIPVTVQSNQGASATGPGTPSMTVDPEDRVANSRAVPPAEGAPEELSRETLARFESARARVRGLVDYFRNDDSRALSGSDENGLLTVEQQRNALRARNGQGAIGSFSLGDPNWRITHSLVSLQANYRLDAKSDAAESGKFRLSMAWREGDWKITHIEVAPSQ